MIINQYKTVKKTVESNILSSQKILCDKCKKEFVIHENNEIISVRNFHDYDYVTIQITEPDPVSRKIHGYEKHFCLDCWINVKELLTFE